MTKTRNISDLLDANGDVKSGALDNVANAVAPTRHSIRPSLNLDFANSKVLDPRITFTRASNATYYDGYTSVKAEENLLEYSQEFDNADWIKQRASVTANNTTAPDGTTTADTLVENTDTNSHNIYDSFSHISGNVYTHSIFVKANGRTKLRLLPQAPNTIANISYDLTAVTSTLNSGTAISHNITDAGNGWYRCSVTFTAGNGGYFQLNMDDVSGNTSYTGDGTSGIHLWGAQIEQRDSLTAYTPTTTQTITNYVPALQTAGNNVARFDHNPTTGESLGLLIEESRTNLVTRSEEFDNAYWGKTNYTAKANQTIAPDGTLSADLLILDDGVSAGVTKSIARGTFTTSGTSAFSIYIKNFGCTGTFYLQDGAGNGVAFNLENNTKSNFGSFISSPVAEDVGNGWYRLKFATSTTSNSFFMYQSGFTGNGHNGVFLWGAQFEQASFPASYIKTTGSQVTRSADIASMTGTNFSDWYRQDEGSIYAEGAPFNLASSGRLYSIDDGTDTINNAIYSIAADTSHFVVRKNGTTEATIDGGTFVANQFAKIAGAYKTNDVAASLDGSAVGTDTSVLLPLVSRMRIGLGFSTNYLNGTIKKLAYYPLRLTNNELVDLTEE